VKRKTLICIAFFLSSLLYSKIFFDGLFCKHVGIKYLLVPMTNHHWKI
jgi:hypothetical protein